MTPVLALLAVVAHVAMHLGKLHAWEQALVYLLAFGPFIVLGIVVYVVRGRGLQEEEDERT